jgi:hypothetical protein
LLIGFSSRVIQSQIGKTRKENVANSKKGVHTHKTMNPFNLRENSDIKDYAKRLTTNGAALHLLVQTYRLVLKPIDPEKDKDEANMEVDGPSMEALGGGGRSTGGGRGDGASKAAIAEVAGDGPAVKEKSSTAPVGGKLRAMDLKEPRHRSDVASKIFGPNSTYCVGAIDPNTREMAVGVIKAKDQLVADCLNGDGDGFTFANKRLSDFDTAIHETINGHRIEHKLVREVRAPKLGDPKPDDAGLSMGKIVGIRSFHRCTEVLQEGQDRCSHLRKSLRSSLNGMVPPTTGHSGPAAPAVINNQGAWDRAQAHKAEEKGRQQARNAIQFPPPRNKNCPPNLWERTGFPRGRQELCEIVRRVSLNVYRSKTNIVRNAKALQRYLKTALVGDVPADEWVRNIPTSQTVYLETYRTYLRYVLPSLHRISEIYFDSKLR